MYPHKDLYGVLQHYRIQARKAQFDDNGNLIIGSGFHLNRPDAHIIIEEVGLAYEAVRAGLQTLDRAQINVLFEADLRRALAYAHAHVANFNNLMPLQQFVAVDLILEMGPDRFDAFTQTIARANAGEWAVGSFSAEAVHWYDRED